jgi:hypothetical protein
VAALRMAISAAASLLKRTISSVTGGAGYRD